MITSTGYLVNICWSGETYPFNKFPIWINGYIRQINGLRFTNSDHYLNITQADHYWKNWSLIWNYIKLLDDLKGKSKYFKGILMFDVKEKKTYVYSVKNNCKYETFFKWMIELKNQKLFKEKKSVFATIFLEPNPTNPSIASILCESD